MSTETDYKKNLGVTLYHMQEAIGWLKRSFERCHRINFSEPLSPEDFDNLEALSGRYARASDLIVSKVFRGIDAVELIYSGGTLIDVVNRAHKRGLIDNPVQIRQIKELRNTIAHEYVDLELIVLFDQVLGLTPILLEVSERCLKYCLQYGVVPEKEV